MTPHLLTVDGLSIFYIEQNHQALNTIFFIHGNSCTSGMWNKQLTDPLLQNFRLIAFDLPGHGQSSAFPDEKEYSLPAIAEVISKAIQLLSGNNPYIITGFSIGTNVVAETLAFNIAPAGLAFAGSCILGGNISFSEVSHPDFDPTVIFTEHPSKEAVDAYWKNALPRSSDAEIQQFREDYNATHALFRSSIFKTAMNGVISNEIALIQEFGKPTLFAFGKEEAAVNNTYLDDLPLPLWKKQVYKIADAGHFVTIEQPKIFNALLLEYAAEVFK